jgi:transposase
LPKTVEIEIDRVIRHALAVAATPPQQRTEVPLPRWTLSLVVWIHQQFQIDCCRDTVRKVLKRLGFSWKKARKLRKYCQHYQTQRISGNSQRLNAGCFRQ